MRSRPRRLLALITSIPLYAGCGKTLPRPATDHSPPSILILVLDACRRDKLGCYNPQFETSPVIDSIAAGPDSVLFSQYHVQASWTKPSTATLFTGLYVHQHGVLIGHEEKDEITGKLLYATQILSDEFTTIAERLSEAGLHTFVVTTNPHLTPANGFGQGFSEFVHESMSDKDKVDNALAIIQKTPGQFFGYVHLNACHNPFPDDHRDAQYMARHGFGYDEKARIAAGIDFGDPDLKDQVRKRKAAFQDDDIRFLNLIYEAKVREVDQKLVLRFVEGLKKLGRFDNTLLFVTADHGEMLLEHGDYAHSQLLWEEILHPPLIAKFPKGGRPVTLGARCDRLVRTIDIYPTLLDWLHLPIPAELPGVSIMSANPPEVTFAEVDKGWALEREGWKLHQTETGTALFQLAEDPHEMNNLASAEPERVASMQAIGKAILASGGTHPAAPMADPKIDEETTKELRSLGYIH